MRARLNWWLVVCCSAVLFGWGVWSGYVADILATDRTYLSSLIFLIYALSTAYLGFCLHTDRKPVWGWLEFADERCVQLGLAGTVAGMLLTMSIFWSGNVFELTEAYYSIGSGSATALYTTIVGLACSEFLKIQMMVSRNDQN